MVPEGGKKLEQTRKKLCGFVARLQTRQMPQGAARYPHNTINARRAGIMQVAIIAIMFRAGRHGKIRRR